MEQQNSETYTKRQIFLVSKVARTDKMEVTENSKKL